MPNPIAARKSAVRREAAEEPVPRTPAEKLLKVSRWKLTNPLASLPTGQSSRFATAARQPSWPWPPPWLNAVNPKTATPTKPSMRPIATADFISSRIPKLLKKGKPGGQMQRVGHDGAGPCVPSSGAAPSRVPIRSNTACATGRPRGLFPGIRPRPLLQAPARW